MAPNLLVDLGSSLNSSLLSSMEGDSDNSSVFCHTCQLVGEEGEDVFVQDNDYSFPEDDYGLLNYAKLYLHLHNLNHSHQFNTTTQILNYDTGFPSNYKTSEIILLCVVMTLMLVVVIIGNMLVIIAIATEHSLAGVQNWFIASLAFADLSIGLVVMPFTLANELLGYWMFGSIWCDIYSAMDVLLCTASITTICLISLDRYWSITKTIDYLNSRTPCRVTLYIVTVWLVSAFISLPPLLGWRKVHDLRWFSSLRDYQFNNNLSNVQFIQFLKKQPNHTLQTFTTTLEGVVFPQCSLSEDTGYVMYSAFGSFYIPTCIMVFVYIQIYFAARARARRNIKPNKNPQKREEYQMKKCGTSQAAPACNGIVPVSSPVKPIVCDNFTAVTKPTNGDIGNGTHPIPSHQEESHSLGNGTLNGSKGSQGSKGESGDRGELSSDSENEEADHADHVIEQNSLGSLLRKVNQKNNMIDPVYTLPVNGTDNLTLDQSSMTNLQDDLSCATEKLVEKNEQSGLKSNNNHSLPLQDLKVQLDKDEALKTTSFLLNQNHNKQNGNGNAKLMEEKLNDEVCGAVQEPASPETERLKTKGDDVSYYGESSTGSDSGRVRCVKIRSRILPKLTLGRRLSKETREMIDIGKLPAKNYPTSEVAQNQEKEKRRMARKKERRAFLILGLIMGSFIACWLPFFILYSISPICPVCGEETGGCCVQGWGFSFAFWLGYSNSALNPVIYTVFNKDFRRAFKKILFK